MQSKKKDPSNSKVQAAIDLLLEGGDRFMDYLWSSRQDKRIINKSVYIALDIDKLGMKDFLDLWMIENEREKFWLVHLTELKNRGLKDILIVCTDNLPGMYDAIGAVYPKTAHQLCIAHQIRNSLQ